MWFTFRLMISFISRLLNENPMLTEPVELSSMKRHSEGTFSNDYSKYLETRRAQDFVQWLKNSKRNGWVRPGWVTHLKVFNWNRTEISDFFNITGIKHFTVITLAVLKTFLQMRVFSQESVQTPCGRHLHQRREFLPAGPGGQGVCVLAEDRPRQKRVKVNRSIQTTQRLTLTPSAIIWFSLYLFFSWSCN